MMAFAQVSAFTHLSLMMASAQVVKVSVNTNNSPPLDYTTNSDDHSNHNSIAVFYLVLDEVSINELKSGIFNLISFLLHQP